MSANLESKVVMARTRQAGLACIRVGEADGGALGCGLVLGGAARRETRQCESGAAVGGRERGAVDNQTDALESGCRAVERLGCGDLLGVYRQEWRNGRRTALKMRRGRLREGSNPSPGTNTENCPLKG